jgi:hypothetical protein
MFTTDYKSHTPVWGVVEVLGMSLAWQSEAFVKSLCSCTHSLMPVAENGQEIQPLNVRAE